MYKITKITYKIVKKDIKIFVVFKVLCQKKTFNCIDFAHM